MTSPAALLTLDIIGLGAIIILFPVAIWLEKALRCTEVNQIRVNKKVLAPKQMRALPWGDGAEDK
eukprot:8840375-Heterocapsa_arctica.AAC.1